MQITLRQLFTVIVVISLLLCLTQAEGCGASVHRIGSISFSPDGKLIALARFDARDARTPGKGYLRDVSRTISVVDAATGRQLKTVQQDSRYGNCGPAFGLFGYSRGDLAFAHNDRLFIREFGGGPVDVYEVSTDSRSQFTKEEFAEIAICKDGSFLVAVLFEEIRVFPLTQNQNPIIRSFPNTRAFAFSPRFWLCENSLATRAADGHSFWDLESGQAIDRVEETEGHNVHNLVLWEENRLVAFSDSEGSLYFADRSKSEKPKRLASKILRHTLRKLPNSDLLAYVTHEPVRSLMPGARGYSLALQDPIEGDLRTFPLPGYPTSVTFSRDGSTVALGDSRGQLTLMELQNGRVVWTTKPAGRYRLPWTVPTLLLVLLFCWHVRPWKAGAK